MAMTHEQDELHEHAERRGCLKLIKQLFFKSQGKLRRF